MNNLNSHTFNAFEVKKEIIMHTNNSNFSALKLDNYMFIL